MRKALLITAVIGVLVFLGRWGVQAQEPTVDDVEAQFGSLTRSEIEALGYVVDPICVSAELEGLPAEQGAMGFHAVNESLFDTTVDPLQPEIILLGPDDEVWGVEYETAAETENPVLFGQQMPLLEGGHPGMEFDHYAIHVWFIDNPAGQFADFNPTVNCPAPPPVVVAPPATGLSGQVARESGLLAGWALMASLAGVAFVAAGWALRRRVSH